MNRHLALPWFVFLGLGAHATGCGVPDLDLSGKPCPCIDGWSCVANQCVPNAPDHAAEGMAAIPAGTFWMGCDLSLDTQCKPDELPGRLVNVSAFEIDLTEVTQEAFQKCVDAPSSGCIKPDSQLYDPVATGAMPVFLVSWAQANTYCAFVGKRLPTEAEWEKAARDGDERLYPWGNQLPSCSDPTTTFANIDGCGNIVRPAGSYPKGASPFHALDMVGNVEEWTADWYSADYYNGAPATDPQGPDSSPTNTRTTRGCAFDDVPVDCRASTRRARDPATSAYCAGFRCAR